MLAITGEGVIGNLKPFLSPSTFTSFLGPDCQIANSLGLSLLLNAKSLINLSLVMT